MFATRLFLSLPLRPTARQCRHGDANPFLRAVKGNLVFHGDLLPSGVPAGIVKTPHRLTLSVHRTDDALS